MSLTWDADDEGRKRALTKKMTADDLKEDDLKVSDELVGGRWTELLPTHVMSVRLAASCFCGGAWLQHDTWGGVLAPRLC